MFRVVLVSPEIPPNTGNVIRLCANTGASLHLVEPLGFPLDDARMRRAGLDYHEFAPLRVHRDWSAFMAQEQPEAARMFAMTTRGGRAPHDVAFAPGDWLVFGSETSGTVGRRARSLRPRSLPAVADASRAAEPEPVQCGRGGRLRSVAAERLRGRCVDLRLTLGARRKIQCS